jgi:hypothetical protein
MTKRDSDLLERIKTFQQDAQDVMAEEIPAWRRANILYNECFDDIEDPANLYNPTIMLDIIDRVIADVSLAQYTLKIQGSSIDARQMVRDAISYVEDASGLTSAIKENNKGAWAWVYLGNMFLWWGASDKQHLKMGILIEFNSVRPTHVFLSSGATAIRDQNGFPLCKEALVIQEYPLDEVKKMFQKSKKIDKVKKGNLSFIETQEIETQRYADKVDSDITQVGHFYDPIDKSYCIIAGSTDEILEKYYDDEYSFSLDNIPYMPISKFSCFQRYDKMYAKGLYHKYAKIANNDKRRRILAHQFAENNVSPDKFVRIADEEYSTFQNQVEMVREIKRNGGDAFIQLGTNSDVQFGDLRTAPLSQEFERMKQDDLQQVTQSGVAINDISIPASQKATNTIAIEKNKTRLADSIVRANASEAIFLRKVIIDYITRYLKGSKAILPSNSKLTIVEGQEIFQYTPDNITMGDVAEYISKNKVFIRSNYSAFDDVGFKLGRINDALPFAQGTPYAQALGQEALETLGYDVTAQDMQQQQQANIKPSQNETQTVAGTTSANAGLSLQ